MYYSIYINYLENVPSTNAHKYAHSTSNKLAQILT